MKESRGELLRRARDAPFKAIANNARSRVCHRRITDKSGTQACDKAFELQQTGDQEISGGLSMCRLISEIDEVLPSLISMTKLGNPALEDYAHFVEVFVQ